MASSRPNVFEYDDYKKFLKDMSEYLRARDKSLSMREIAKRSGISNSYLSLILTTEKHLAEKTLNKVIPQLSLTSNEASYLKVLRDMADTSTGQAKSLLLGRLRKFKSLEEVNAPDSDLISYLSKWYHVAIRELASTPGFKLDSDWIRQQIAFPVHTRDVNRALRLLVDRGFLIEKQKGKAEPADKRLQARDHIYSVALANLHEQFLQLAVESINLFPKKERSMKAHVMTLNEDNMARAKQILDEAIEKIAALKNEETDTNRVFYFGLIGFPLTMKEK